MWGGPGDREVLWEPQNTRGEVDERRQAFLSDTRHSHIARHMQGLRRYAVNRGIDAQPGIANVDPPPKRIAELWWDSLRDIEDAFNSPSGLADIGDAAVRLPPIPINFPEYMSGPNITFSEERVFEVSNPAGLDLYSGTYEGDLLVKLYGFIEVADPISFDDHYSESSDLVARSADVRGHVLDRRVIGSIRVGNIVRGEQPAGDRVVNLWFDDVSSIDRFANTRQGRRYFSELAASVISVNWVAMRNQEIFFSYELREDLYGQ